jgi:hypothetical protein
MAKISDLRNRSAHAAASRANELGGMVEALGKFFLWVISIGSLIALWAIYDNFNYGSEFTDWGSIWPMWGVVFAGWLFYVTALLIVMTFGSIAQVQAESLEIQILQAQD